MKIKHVEKDLIVPTIAICGYGRAGKDTAAEWFRDHSILEFCGGCSWTGLPYVAKRLCISEEEAWNTRHHRRMEWYEILNEYRKDDPTRLIKDVLKHSEIICGIRDKKELISGQEENLIDLTIWIENNRVDVDPTVTYSVDDCDLIIRNCGTLEDFYKKLYRLTNSLHILNQN